MSGLEFNKIIASIFVAIIIFIIIGLIGNFIVKKDQFTEQENAYLIELPEKNTFYFEYIKLFSNLELCLENFF